jgi:serine/threonine protein phosphatase PrpC
VVVSKDNSGDRSLFVSNVGDSRAVLCRKNSDSEMTYLRVTKDHRATDLFEGKRISAAGSKIKNGRVKGGLAITRAIGDHAHR